MAAPKKLSAGQIINQLRRTEVALANGKRVKQVCRELGVSEQRNLSTTMGHSTGLIREQSPVW